MKQKQTKRSVPAQEVVSVIQQNPNIKDVVVNWSRRGGKTHFAVNDVIAPFLFYSGNTGSRITYITSTLKHAKDILWQPLLTALGPIIKRKSTGEGRMVVTNQYGKESIIQLLGWQTIDTIRGTANDIVIYDETQLLSDFFENHNTAVKPTMLTTKGRRFYLFTPLGFNHCYELKNIATESQDWFYSEADWTQFKHIDPVEIEKDKAIMTEHQFAQEYLCQFIKPDGLVLDSFNPDVHIFTEDEEIIGDVKKVICGVDFGYGNGNTAIIKAVITKTQDGRDRYWITEEIYRRGSELQTHQIAAIIAKMKPTMVWADSADKMRVLDLQRTGLPVQPVHKHNNYKNSLIARVNQAIKQDRVRFKKNSVQNLIGEMGMWFWNTKTEIIRPDKSTKHDAIDAMLYLIGSNEEFVTPERVIQKPKIYIPTHKPFFGI